MLATLQRDAQQLEKKIAKAASAGDIRFKARSNILILGEVLYVLKIVVNFAAQTASQRPGCGLCGRAADIMESVYSTLFLDS